MGWSLSLAATEKWSISCHISKQGFRSQQRLQPPWTVSWWALGHSGPRGPAIRLQPLPPVSPKGAQDENKANPGQGELGSFWKEWVSGPRLLHLPIHGKAPNSLTWDSCLPFINNSLLMFRLGASLAAQMVKNLPEMQETWVQSLGWKDPWRKEGQPTPVSLPGESHGQRTPVGLTKWKELLQWYNPKIQGQELLCYPWGCQDWSLGFSPHEKSTVTIGVVCPPSWRG